MTRAERAAVREQRLKDELAAKSRQLAQVHAQQRAAERAERAKRRQRVGCLADDAGLFDWEDGTLAGLFQALALLKETPDPVAVLASLLACPGHLDAQPVNGTAHAARGVGPACRVG
jgi:hypothetical protein